MRQPKKNPLYKSFGYAFEGISALEWCVCFILFGLILSLELVNTAVEAVVDFVTEERTFKIIIGRNWRCSSYS